MDIRKSEFRVAGATQDATSTERCDLTQDPSSCYLTTSGSASGYSKPVYHLRCQSYLEKLYGSIYGKSTISTNGKIDWEHLWKLDWEIDEPTPTNQLNS